MSESNDRIGRARDGAPLGERRPEPTPARILSNFIAQATSPYRDRIAERLRLLHQAMQK